MDYDKIALITEIFERNKKEISEAMEATIAKHGKAYLHFDYDKETGIIKWRVDARHDNTIN